MVEMPLSVTATQMVPFFSGNNASGDMSFVGNGINNHASGRMGTIINGQDNSASANGAFVGTGMSNRASGEFGSIVSGKNNMASGSYSVIGTGTFNVASGFNSFIASGQSEGSGIVNEASGDGAFIGSGEGNRASGRNAFVSSGYQINATGEYSHAIGGQFSSASGPRSMSMGSYAYAEHENSTVLNAGAKKCASDDVNQFKICSNTKVAAKFYADEFYMKTPLLSEGYANLNVLLYFLTALCFIQSCAIIGIILVINRREKKVMNQETGELEVKKMPILPCFGGRDSSVQPGKKVKKYKINPRGSF